MNTRAYFAGALRVSSDPSSGGNLKNEVEVLYAPMHAAEWLKTRIG